MQAEQMPFYPNNTMNVHRNEEEIEDCRSLVGVWYRNENPRLTRILAPSIYHRRAAFPETVLAVDLVGS